MAKEYTDELRRKVIHIQNKQMNLSSPIRREEEEFGQQIYIC